MATATKPNKLDSIDAVNLARGSHSNRSNGLCVMEAVAWMAGEKHSDHPECVCPVIGTFLRSWNDGLKTDDDRNRLLKPIAPLTIGTKSTPAIEKRRSLMALDWYMRRFVPQFLALCPATAEIGTQMAAFPEIVDTATAAAFAPLNQTAKQKAAAARDAAGAAARDAARAAAGAAAWDAAMAAAWDAAMAAAWDAAMAAAWAAWEKLAPTVSALQTEAQDLVRRMCGLND